jgi:hypothetical protein
MWRHVTRTQRIILVGIPPLLSDLVRSTLAEDPDLEIVAELDGTASVEEPARAARADCLVTALDGVQVPPAYASAVRKRPGMRLVGLIEGGRRCLVYELLPRCSIVGELSPDTLRQTVRGGGQTPCDAGNGLR